MSNLSISAIFAIVLMIVSEIVQIYEPIQMRKKAIREGKLAEYEKKLEETKERRKNAN